MDERADDVVRSKSHQGSRDQLWIKRDSNALICHHMAHTPISCEMSTYIGSVNEQRGA